MTFLLTFHDIFMVDAIDFMQLRNQLIQRLLHTGNKIFHLNI